MAQISKGDTFTNGEQVTGSRLNQLVDASQLLVGAITDQPSITANTLQSTDSTIVNDAGVLKEATIGDFLNSNLPITTSSITGGAGVDIVVAPAAGQKFDVNGAFEANSLNVTGNSTIAGNETVTGNLLVTGTTTMTGNATASGDLAVTGNLTAGGNPVQKNVGIALLTRDLTRGGFFTCTPSAWNDIPYNTIVQINPFVVNSASFTGVLSSAGTGVITLPAGTYVLDAETSGQAGGGTGNASIRLINSTTGVVIKYGKITTCDRYGHATALMSAIFTLSTQADVKVQYFVNSTMNTNFDGPATGIPSPSQEVVFIAKIMKFV